eukprot:scaffold3795_cov126-Isochrysis_galbana.AAC.2
MPSAGAAQLPVRALAMQVSLHVLCSLSQFFYTRSSFGSTVFPLRRGGPPSSRASHGAIHALCEAHALRTVPRAVQHEQLQRSDPLEAPLTRAGSARCLAAQPRHEPAQARSVAWHCAALLCEHAPTLHATLPGNVRTPHPSA